MEEDRNLREVPISQETVFKGRLVEVRLMEVALPNGKTAQRELVYHRGGVAIVPVDSQGVVTLVRQHRIALDEMTLEVPAGKLDTAGEDPLLAAHRELEEECGLRAGQMRLMTHMVPTPGYLTERLHIYLATELSHCRPHLDTDEFLSVERMPLEEAVELVLQGQLTDAKTALGLMMARELLARRGLPSHI